MKWPFAFQTRLSIGLLGLSAVIALGTAPAFADTIFDVEHARANARGGGPVSEHDAELLNRWGALSGTPGWRPHYRESAYDEAYDRPVRFNERRRLYRD